MPVVPNFSSYAPTPDLAQSFLGGARISAEIAQHARHLQFQQARLAQDAQLASMELQAKRETAQSEMLRKQQEMEMEKAYKEAQIGLGQRKLDEEAKIFEFKAQQAAQQSMIQQTAARRIAGGEDATKVWQELAPQAGLRLPAGLFRSQQSAPTGPAIPLEGAPGMLQAQTSAGHRRIFAAPPGIGDKKVEKLEGTGGKFATYGNRILNLGDPAKPIRDQIKALKKEAEKAYDAEKSAIKAIEEEGSTSSYNKATAAAKKARDLEIKKLQDQLEALEKESAGGATLPSGSRTNKIGRFTIIE